VKWKRASRLLCPKGGEEKDCEGVGGSCQKADGMKKEKEERRREKVEGKTD
jgi:hypothetical protein